MRHRRRNKNKAAGVASGRVVTSTDRTNQTGSSESLTDVSYGETNMEASETTIVLDVECGPNKAKFYLDKVQMGSKGQCVFFEDSWLTPNEFQFVSGRETAKDWKRSIRHHDKSLKLLMSRGLLSLSPAECRCEHCVGKSTEVTNVEPDTMDHECVSPAGEASPPSQSDQDSPIKDDSRVTVQEVEERLWDSKTIAKTRKRPRNASPKRKNKKRAKKHRASCKSTGINTHILKIKRMDDSNEYVACVVASDAQGEGTDTSKRPRSARGQNGNNITNKIRDIKVSEKLNGVHDDTNNDAGQATEETDEYDFDNHQVENKELGSVKDNIIAVDDAEKCVSDCGKNEMKIQVNFNAEVELKDVEEVSMHHMDTYKDVRASLDKHDSTARVDIRADSVSATDTTHQPGVKLDQYGHNSMNGNSKQALTAEIQPVTNKVEYPSVINDQSSPKEDLCVESESDEGSKAAQADLTDKDGCGLEGNVNSKETLNTYYNRKIQLLENDTVAEGKNSPVELINEISAINTVDSLTASLPDGHECKHINSYGTLIDNINCGSKNDSSLRQVATSDDAEKYKNEKTDDEYPNEQAVPLSKSELTIHGSNSVPKRDSTAGTTHTHEPEQSPVNADAGLTAETESELDEPTDETASTPTKEARLTSIINQLRSYKKQLNMKMDVQKASDNPDIGLTLPNEQNLKVQKLPEQATTKLPFETQGRPASTDPISRVTVSSQTTNLKPVTPSIVSSHVTVNQSPVSGNKVRDFGHIFLSESSSVSSPPRSVTSTASPVSSACVFPNLGSVLAGSSTVLGADTSLPFMSYPYPFPGMVTTGVHPATNCLPALSTVPPSSGLPMCPALSPSAGLRASNTPTTTSGLQPPNALAVTSSHHAFGALQAARQVPTPTSLPVSNTLSSSSSTLQAVKKVPAPNSSPVSNTLSASSHLSTCTVPPTVPSTHMSPAALSDPMQYNSLYAMYGTLAAHMAAGDLGRSGIVPSSRLNFDDNIISYTPLSTGSAQHSTESSRRSRDVPIARKIGPESRPRSTPGVRLSSNENTTRAKAKNVSQYGPKESTVSESLEFRPRADLVYDEHGALDLTSSLRSVEAYPSSHVVRKPCSKSNDFNKSWSLADLQSSGSNTKDKQSLKSESHEYTTRKPSFDFSVYKGQRKHDDRGSGSRYQVRQSRSKQGRVSDRGLTSEIYGKSDSVHVSRSSNVFTSRPSAANLFQSAAMMNSLYTSSSQNPTLASAHAAAVAAIQDYPVGSPYHAALAAGINPALLGLVQNPFFNPYSA